MAILKERDRQLVKSKFDKELEGDVRIIVFTQEFECEYCEVNRELVEELASLSPKIKVEVYDFEKDKDRAERWKVDKIPATLIFGEKEYGIRYFGVPSGYEFAALLDDIVDVSRRKSRLPNNIIKELNKINSPVHIKVFVTPTCPYCPRAVRTAHQFALENDNIVADMIESLEFPHLANKYQVMAVPKIVINDVISFEGALPEALFLEQVLAAVESGGRLTSR